MLQPLTWSEPHPTGWASIEAKDGDGSWRITPVPRDVTRIYFSGQDADGTIISATEHPAYAESAEEAKILVDLLRAGTDHLPGWREQLEAAGFVRSYPTAADGDILSALWNDQRKSGLFQLTILDGSIDRNGCQEIAVSATYETDRSTFWHNVCSVDGTPQQVYDSGGIKVRSGLPAGIDALKAGVAAAIAIKEARLARGGRFAKPLGGETKER